MAGFETETPSENESDNWIEDEFKNMFAMYDEFISSAKGERKLAAIESKGSLLAKFAHLCYAYAEDCDSQARIVFDSFNPSKAKSLHNSKQSRARENVKDIRIVGNGDSFALLFKGRKLVSID